MRCSAYLAVSLDGYIARPDGALDWLRAGGPRPADEARVFAEFVAGVDAVVLGRNTFDVVRSRLGVLYGERPVVVLSHRPLAGPTLVPAVEQESGALPEILGRCAARGWRELYVDGAQVIQQCIAAGCLHRLVINRVPVLLGRGIPLFGAVENDRWLQHVRTSTYPGGLVQTEYHFGVAPGRDGA